jgi:hypothetical protein
MQSDTSLNNGNEKCPAFMIQIGCADAIDNIFISPFSLPGFK